MKIIKLAYFILFMWFLFLFPMGTSAVEPLPSDLINFSSESGLVLFKKNAQVNSLKLLSNFTTQKIVTYCGVASAVMVLNSTNLIPPRDLQHSPYRYFNQDNFFNDLVKKIITPEETQKKGMSLTKLSQVMRSYGLNVRPFFANALHRDEFRKILKNALLNQQFIIVNFSRTELHQQGGGHHSPIAAYDDITDRFLLLDVARYKYPFYWVKTADLWKAVNTVDEGIYRGFILINPPL